MDDFYTKDEKSMPGRKGISLSSEQWGALSANKEKVDQALGIHA